MINNQVTVVSNYANTIELQQTLNLYDERGYKTNEEMGRTLGEND